MFDFINKRPVTVLRDETLRILEEERHAHTLSKEQMALLLGIGENMYRKMLTRKRNPGPTVWSGMLRAFPQRKKEILELIKLYKRFDKSGGEEIPS